MGRISLVLTAFIRTLALASIVAGPPLMPRHVWAGTQAPGFVDINPSVAKCNTTPDAVPQADPKVPMVPTAINAALLTSGLPCAETVSTKGLTNDALLNLQRGFDFYSWLTFIALNSPDDGAPIGKSKKGPDAQTLWESNKNYQQLADIMLPDGRPPVWGVRHIPAACSKDFKDGMMLIQVTEETYNQPFKTGPLIDQNGHYALFDILLNKPMFDYIRVHGLSSKAGQREFNDPVTFPVGINPGKGPDGKPMDGSMGAIMLKVSWKVMDPDKDRMVMANFHTVDALVFMPASADGKVSAACVPKKLGLIGFHAVHKTTSRPQWIWTTFEHVDNAPEMSDIAGHALKDHYNFYAKSCDSTTCPINQTPPRPWTPDSNLKFHDVFRSQIVRMMPIQPDALDLNAKFQSILAGTVWKNYMLVNTQWPSDFACTKNTDPSKVTDETCAPAPTFLANTTLETYSQAEESGAVPLATSSCMACHGNAATQGNPSRASDFTFTLEKAH